MKTNIRFAAFGFVGATFVWWGVHSGPAIAQNVKVFIVRLQSTTPGTAQVGHSNITGTSISGQFQGGGGGLTGLNASNLSLGTVPSARIAGAYTGISGVGTLTAGTWNASPVAATFGGTGLNSFATGDILYASSGSTLNRLPVGVAGQFLKVSGGLPVWGAISSSDITVPFTLSGTQSGGHILKGANTSTGIGSSGLFGESTNATGTTYAVYGKTASSGGIGVYGYATSASGGSFGLYGQSDSTSGYALYANNTALSGNTYGVYAIANSPAGRGVYAIGGTEAVYGVSTTGTGLRAQTTSGGTALYAERTVNGNRGWFGGANEGGWAQSTAGDGMVGKSGASNRSGVYGENSASGTAYGVAGNATAATGTNYGIHGSANSTSGFGVYGRNTTSGNYGHIGSDNYAVFGLNPTGGTSNYGALGMDLYGVYGSFNGGTSFGHLGSQDKGVYGFGRYGVWGNGGPTGFGVVGYNSGTSNIGILSSPGGGVYGIGDASSPGVYGYSDSRPGLEGQSALGDAIVGRTYNAGKSSVFGYTEAPGANGGYFNTAATTGTGIGVIGQTNAAAQLGVYAIGNLGASGVKLFHIDHPLDPYNKFLNHASIEAPEALNFYRGKVVLDSRGEAWVRLPDYFEEINVDFQYQLTCVGGFAQVYIAQEIAGNRFKIAGGKPGLKVCWTVTGARNDRFVRQHRTPTEENKPEDYRGKLINPELYGQPKENGIYYRAPRSAGDPAAVSRAIRAEAAKR